MGKSIKKILKGIETKNGKNKEREDEMEKSQVKDRPKVRSIWSKWSSLFTRTSSSRIRSAKPSIPQLSEPSQIPQILMNNSPKDMERWSHDESLDVNSQMLNIPIEPGRQVSTIILSPTKTGFKAVIAHYDVNASVRRSLTKDFKTVSEQIENRRTLTLVFDMNQRTFEEIGVGKSECRVRDEEHSVDRDDNRNISASALYVRDDADELVESAAFLQAQLSLDNMALNESSLFISEEKSINVERRHVSCRSIERSRVAFKTISEPMCKEKEEMRKEMLIKQNIQEMLNQFIFLERDDSLMNYPRVCEEVPVNVGELREERDETEEEEEEEEGEEEEAAAAAAAAVAAAAAAEAEKEEQESRDGKDMKKWSTPEYFLPEDFSVFKMNSARNVASNILVNIKPFKEYIGSYPKIDVKTEKSVPKKAELTTKNNEKYPLRPPQNALSTGPRKKFEERGNKHAVKFQKLNTKSRLSLCIKCGTEERGDETKKLKRETSTHFSKNVYKTSDHSSVTAHTGKSRSSVAITPSVREDIPCTLCSVWKRYKKKSSFTSITHVGDSFEDILKEFESYDHEMMFRQNISQFKTKISSKSPSIEFKTSHSSLSFAEVIELEEGKVSQVKNHKVMLEDSKMDDMQRVTVRLIEFVRKNKEKTVELQRIRTAMEQLYFEKIPLEPTAEISRFENSSLVFTFRESNKMIKVMAQKIEENMLRSFTNANEVIISEANTTVIFPAYINWARVSNLGIPRRHSENRLEEFRRSFTNYKRPGQIPDVINHLLTNKVDDLRNELITSLNETRMIYNSESFRSVQLERVSQDEGSKAFSDCANKCLAPPATYSGEDATEASGQQTDLHFKEYTEKSVKETEGEEPTKAQDGRYSAEYNREHLGAAVEQSTGNYEEENLKERPEFQIEEFLEPQLFSGSSLSQRASPSSSASRQSEQNLQEDVYKTGEFVSVQEKSTETILVQQESKEKLELTEGPAELKNMDVGLKNVLSFKARSDYSVHSCLTFFIPYVQQIQTAIEILNNIAYDFPIMKEAERRVDKDCIQIMGSYTLLSDKKKYLMDRGVESVIAKKCMEKNVVNGIETSKTSKKEITTIESSKSGNHLFVTSKRILTNDRIKKTEIVGGGVEAESSSKIHQGNNESVLLRTNLPEDSEDVNGIRFLYCNRSDGNGTCESSVASNFSYGLDKVRESSSSVIAVNELGETMRASTDVRLSEPEEEIEGYCQQTATTCEHSNKVENSLQEIDDGTGKLTNSSMKCEVVTLSQKAKDSIINSRESVRPGLTNKVTKKPSCPVGESKISVTKRDSVKVKVTEEKLIINKEELSNVLLPQNLRTPSVKVIKKVGKGIVSQRVTTKSSGSGGGGREILVRQEEDKMLKKTENENAKRMSVVITLSKRKKESDRSSSAPGKYHSNCQSSRGMIKLTKISSSVPGNRKS